MRAPNPTIVLTETGQMPFGGVAMNKPRRKPLEIGADAFLTAGRSSANLAVAGLLGLFLAICPLSLSAGGKPVTWGVDPNSPLLNVDGSNGAGFKTVAGSVGASITDIQGGQEAIAPGTGCLLITCNLGSDPAVTPFVKDPVNMVNGNMYHNETDIAIKGRGGLPLVFQRVYNSREAKDGPLGFGWTHSFNQYLLFQDDNVNGVIDPPPNPNDPNSKSPDADGITSSVLWIDGTGGQKAIPVIADASGVTRGKPFAPLAGHFLSGSRTAPAGTYEITDSGGTVYTFENVDGIITAPPAKPQKARLSEIKDRNKNKLTLNYVGDNLVSVKDDLNRTLSFAYDANGHIKQVTDFSGRVWTYAYDDGRGNLNRVIDPLNLTTTYVYASFPGKPGDHAMTSFQYSNGYKMNFEYYSNGQAFRHFDALGNANTFTYNALTRESTSVDERGNTRRYFFNAQGTLTRVVMEDGGERNFVYDTVIPANKLSSTDELGYVRRYVYDSGNPDRRRQGDLKTVIGPDNATSTIDYYNAFGQPGVIKDALGNTTLLKYDPQGNLLESILLNKGVDPGATPTSFVPTSAGQILSWVINSYDPYGNVLTTKQIKGFTAQGTPIAGLTLSFAYDPNHLNLLTVTRSGLINTAAATETSPAMAYDSLGRVTTGVTGNWYTTTVQPDALGRPIRASDGMNQLRDYTYYPGGNLKQVSLTVGGVLLDSVSTVYDLANRPISVTSTAGASSSMQYDAAGNVISATNADGFTVTSDYDEMNRLVKSTDGLGNSVVKTLDLAGRPRSVTDPNGGTVTYEYYPGTGTPGNSAGRLKSVSEFVNAAFSRKLSYEYDANGNTVRVTDSGGRQTRMAYDAANRLIRSLGPVSASSNTCLLPGGTCLVTVSRYNLLGQLTDVLAGSTTAVDPNSTASEAGATLQRHYDYDDLGRKTAEKDPRGNTWTFVYDSNNNLSKTTDANGQATTFTYGYGGQLLTRTEAGGTRRTTYTRDLLGQVTQVTGPDVSYSYKYDADHRLIEVKDSRGNLGLRYAYSPGGLLNTMVDNEGGQTDYLYDSVGRLTGIWAPGYDYIAFDYDAGGRLTEKWSSNGNRTRYTYRADNRLTRLVNLADTTIVSQHDYTYDDASAGIGNRITHTENIAGNTISYSYGYDALSRLISVTAPAVPNADPNKAIPAIAQGYTYDVLGNRTSFTPDGTTANNTSTQYYNYDPVNQTQLEEVRLGSVSGTMLKALIYDASGNLIKQCEGTAVTRVSDSACTGSVVRSYTYNPLNKLATTTITGQPTGTFNESYVYDDSGRRIRRTTGTAATSWFYNGEDIYTEYTGSDFNKASALYVQGPGIDNPLIRKNQVDKSSRYYQADGLGSVIATTDGNSIAGTQRFDAYGVPLGPTGVPLPQ